MLISRNVEFACDRNFAYPRSIPTCAGLRQSYLHLPISHSFSFIFLLPPARGKRGGVGAGGAPPVSFHRAAFRSIPGSDEARERSSRLSSGVPSRRPPPRGQLVEQLGSGAAAEPRRASLGGSRRSRSAPASSSEICGPDPRGLMAWRRARGSGCAGSRAAPNLF
jgi:hypothetical protein